MKRKWLKEIREKNNLTQKEVAMKVKISRQYYGMIENGERVPSVDTAKKIAEIFNISWTIFFDVDSYKSLQCSY